MPMILVNPSGHGHRVRGRKRVGKLAPKRNPMARRRSKKKPTALTMKYKRHIARRKAAKKGWARKARKAPAVAKRRKARKARKAPAVAKRRKARKAPARKRRKVGAKTKVRRRRRKAARKGWRARKSRWKRQGVYKGKTMAGAIAPSKSSRRRAGRRAKYAARKASFARTVRANPARRSRRYRRNPSMGGIMGLLKQVAPIVGAMLAGKMLAAQINKHVPQISANTGGYSKVAVNAILLGAVHFAAPKVAILRKHQSAIMMGLGVNLVLETLAAVLPEKTKSQIGLSGDGIYDRALADYVQTSEYLTTDASIDDDMTMSDYVTTGELEEELGLSEELGISEELGLDAGTVRGGLSSTAMVRSVPGQDFSRSIEARSFTRQIGHVSEGFDNAGGVYAGIFRGGF